MPCHAAFAVFDAMPYAHYFSLDCLPPTLITLMFSAASMPASRLILSTAATPRLFFAFLPPRDDATLAARRYTRAPCFKDAAAAMMPDDAACCFAVAMITLTDDYLRLITPPHALRHVTRYADAAAAANIVDIAERQKALLILRDDVYADADELRERQTYTYICAARSGAAMMRRSMRRSARSAVREQAMGAMRRKSERWRLCRFSLPDTPLMPPGHDLMIRLR